MSKPYSLSTRTVVLVGVLAVLLPIFSRVVASPLVLLLVSPLILLVLLVGYLGLSVYGGWVLDVRAARDCSGLQYTARPLAFSTPAAWQAVKTRSQWSQNATDSLPLLDPESPEASKELNDVIKLIIRDFVHSWYDQISSSPSFPTAVSSLIHSSLQQILSRVEAMDLPALVVKRIIPKITAHVEQFRESEVALRGAALERRLTQSEELDLLLASRYVSKGTKLHPAVENLATTFTKQTEELHLRRMIDKVLPLVLPSGEKESKSVRLVVREILACSVLYPVVDMIADPDFWNRTIDSVVSVNLKSRPLLTLR